LRLELLGHRGPDDQGQEVYYSQSQKTAALLGSTRLAIIDLSSAGHMPMEYPGEPLALVYNGEVYNFQELRGELEKHGERFFSRTDTEVILRGYRVWGEGVVDRLQGMFAFALFDGRGEGRLLLARDRFGKKPLYFREEAGGGIWFASELKALLAGGGAREIDPGGLKYYLDRGYPPSDRCLLRGYGKVLPGHLLIWERGELRDRPYWRLPEAGSCQRPLSEPEAAEEMRARLTGAVKKRLIADVPIGLLLSGGVDSTSLLALMSKFSPHPVATYTASFGTANLDEGEKARRTALLMGCQHHALMVSPRSGRLLPFIASHMDEPIADPAAIATYLICRRARQDVTVLLTGDGSDELLLGYPRYRLHAAAQIMSRIFPPGMLKLLSQPLPPWSLLGRTLSAPEDPLVRDRYWLNHGKERAAAFSRSTSRFSKDEAVRLVLKEDLATWLVEDVLMKVDKMSMASAVEIRVPFLDQGLADWMVSLPVSARMSWRQGKKVLYAAMGGLVPKHISWSRKQPFQLPVEDWLRSEWRILARDVLLDQTTRQRGWLDGGAVNTLLAEHLAGKANHARRLYQLLILELWARAILDRGESEPVPVKVDDCARELAPDRPVRRVAVLAPAGIGDTMRLTPALRQLGESDANVSVTLYVASGRGSDEVMAGMAPVDRHVLVDFQGPSIAKLFQLIKDLRKNPPEELNSTWFSRVSGLVHLLGGVKEQNGWTAPWSLIMKLNKFFYARTVRCDPSQRDAGISDTVAFGKLLGMDSLNTLAPFFAPPIWEEKALAQARQKLAGLPRPVLAVNGVAQASIRQREYPLKLMAQALTELLARGIIRTVVLLGDAQARQGYGPLASLLGASLWDLSGELSLSATAEVMRLCDGVLSIDGGLLHIALATSLPVAALYGPTEVYSSDPRGERGRYLVLSANHDCRCICENHRGIKVVPECREQASCLSSLPPSRIVASVSALLANQAASGEQGPEIWRPALEAPLP
jgi:asparagine synthase (glutamine-hydrolysing)